MIFNFFRYKRNSLPVEHWVKLRSYSVFMLIIFGFLLTNIVNVKNWYYSSNHDLFFPLITVIENFWILSLILIFYSLVHISEGLSEIILDYIPSAKFSRKKQLFLLFVIHYSILIFCFNFYIETILL